MSRCVVSTRWGSAHIRALLLECGNPDVRQFMLVKRRL